MPTQPPRLDYHAEASDGDLLKTDHENDLLGCVSALRLKDVRTQKD
ncbi:hypothetical protein PC129_g1141 [Phytophthora cactorum]|uniref:Uncharacterized protein n=1 Tax=Phytophthora cactorum TaxID=29920 RepID=A0A8T1L694_9STRA|nr:hypothetical protein Pcac1_g4598 [Phytophthora cactorum]KAG3048780.1 hypothetical protein PI125_g26674 [Phytophthora idaei]KAG2930512.1 hypothetical protein PC114_g2468 [Phytophthora cactorum]KAG2954478.1 hypothetical protein PC117_g1168 [Phytophthora cactorum]KAG3025960.1 hypothetical protein PC120_g6156 [Phytophthora cactorum]